MLEAAASHGITVCTHVTREEDTAASNGSSDGEKMAIASTAAVKPSASSSSSRDHGHRPSLGHPDLSALVPAFVDGTSRGRTTVFASGPGGMITELRSIVAKLNSAKRVWRGEAKFDVELLCDDRLEW